MANGYRRTLTKKKRFPCCRESSEESMSSDDVSAPNLIYRGREPSYDNERLNAPVGRSVMSENDINKILESSSEEQPTYLPKTDLTNKKNFPCCRGRESSGESMSSDDVSAPNLIYRGREPSYDNERLNAPVGRSVMSENDINKILESPPEEQPTSYLPKTDLTNKKNFPCCRGRESSGESMSSDDEGAPDLIYRGREPSYDNERLNAPVSRSFMSENDINKILESPPEEQPTSYLPKTELTNKKSFPCCRESSEESLSSDDVGAPDLIYRGWVPSLNMPEIPSTSGHSFKSENKITKNLESPPKAQPTTYYDTNRESSEEDECMPCNERPAAEPELKLDPYDMEDVITRGRAPPQNLPRLPERFKTINRQHLREPQPSESARQSSHMDTVDPKMMQVYERGLWPRADPRVPARFFGERPKPDPNKSSCSNRDQRIPDRFLPPELQSRPGYHRDEPRIPERFLRPEGSNTPLCSFMPGKQRIPERFLQSRGHEAQEQYRRENEKPPSARYSRWHEPR